MAIKELITLEGSEQVKKALNDLGKAGEDALGQFRDLGKDAGGAGFDKISQAAGEAGKGFDEASVSAKGFTEALHILRPVLQELGVGLTNIRELSTLARAGFVGLAAAIAAAAAVGFGKLQEEAARTRGVLDDLFKGGGPQAFEALNSSAKLFGTTVAGLLPGLEAMQKAINDVDRTRQGFVALKAEDLPTAFAPPNVTAVTDAYANLLKLLRAGRLTQDDAQKSAAAFFETLRNGGVLTKATLQNLPTGTVELLKEAFGAAGLTTQAFFAQIEAGGVGVDKVTQALAKFGPQADKAFDSKAIKTMGDALQRLLDTATKKEVGGTSFSDVIIGGLNLLNDTLDFTIRKFNELFELVARLKALTQVNAPQGPTLEQAGLGGFVGPLDAGKAADNAAKTLGKSFITADSSVQKLGVTGAEAGNKVAAGFDKAKQSIDATTRSLEAQAQSLRSAVDSGVADVQQLIDAENALHDASKPSADDFKVGGRFGPQVASPFGESAGQDAGGKLAAGTAKGFINNINTAAPEMQAATAQAVVPAPQAILDKLTGMENVGQQIDKQVQQGIDQSVLDFSSWLTAVQTFGTSAVSQAQQIYEQIKQIFAQPIQLNIQGGNVLQSTAPFASGGRVSGPGTTTSDSILAFLSNKEWVINARAVDFYGNALFAALNSMRLPRDLIMNTNKFAGGGQVTTGGTPVTLVIGGSNFDMRTSDETVSRLRRVAVRSQMASAGRAPGWVK